MWTKVLVGFALCAAYALAQEEAKNVRDSQDAKVISLFNIVKFAQEPCTSTVTGTGTKYRNGTCMTEGECKSASGAPSGACASGFGICCVFVTSTCGSTISRNETYIRNPNSPNPYTQTTACAYSVNAQNSDICFLRLDFETFSILGMSTTTSEATTTDPSFIDPNPCRDLFTVTTATGQNIPTICGSNTGQHMYIEVSKESKYATLSFTFGSETYNRVWDIKVSQIECTSISRPPQGCLQYHTDLDGSFRTFNYDANDVSLYLPNHQYNICIRRAEGHCCTKYFPCSGDLTFAIGGEKYEAGEMGFLDTSCTGDYIAISGAQFTQSGASGVPQHNQFCGAVLASTMEQVKFHTPVYSCSGGPFYVGIKTDTISLLDAASLARPRGVCLDYTQTPCRNGA